MTPPADAGGTGGPGSTRPPRRLPGHGTIKGKFSLVGSAGTVIAVTAILAFIGCLLDLLNHGPLPAALAVAIMTPVALAAFAGAYLGALTKPEFMPARVLRMTPEVLVVDILLAAVIAVASGLIHLGGLGGGGGQGSSGVTPEGSPPGAPDPPRSNFASELVDPVDAAAALGVRAVTVTAIGINTRSHAEASVTALNARGWPSQRLLLRDFRSWLKAGALMRGSSPLTQAS